MRRREFLATAAAAMARPASGSSSITDRICMFTDHLGGFDYKEVAVMFQQLGISGPDLTVRPGGLVKPERVTEDLPKAAAIFKDHGLKIPMITTGITSVRDPNTKAILSTASDLGIGYFKLGYYPYENMSEWEATRASAHNELADVVKMAHQFDIRAGFHNHSGANVGFIIWDALEVLEEFDPDRIGLFFDPSHATIEGGKSGWSYSFLRAAQRLKMVAIKDFIWEKSGGQWRTRWVPLGQGMVNVPEFLKMLAKTPFLGPLSLHIEYDPGGKTKTEKFDRALEAAARDIKYLKEQLKLAFGA